MRIVRIIDLTRKVLIENKMNRNKFFGRDELASSYVYKSIISDDYKIIKFYTGSTLTSLL